ncbi:MAG: FKBP-type peptidyl-prolyl cis-trans isomerase [Bacteroidales bacterium]|nr:FKBP-type peptidyl-prolyl cis-trans isomerase [Bacteroidales bacterium]
MKRNFIYNLLAIAAVSAIAVGCAKSHETSAQEEEEEYLKAWLQVNHPDAVKSGYGIYILDDQPGTGANYKGEGAIYVLRTIRSLDGTVASTNDGQLAKQLGTYKQQYYYGPHMTNVAGNNAIVGITDMLYGMKIGGTRTALIPSWLMTFDRYASEEEYKKHENDYSPAIYTITLEGAYESAEKWEGDSLARYIMHNYPGVSASEGYAYYTIKAPKKPIPADSTVYINYTGRLTNGQVFDTTVEDTAKVYNIWSSRKTYAPVAVKTAAKDNAVTMGGSTVVEGFGHAVNNVGVYGHGISIFMSKYGYGSTGSGAAIPPYSPLVFEIEVVDKP